MPATLVDVASKTFDYVVVGGGTGGLTVAARLSEDPNASVLVLEAGPANIGDPAILRPASFGAHFGNPDYSWSHKTVPQKYVDNAEKPWDRGKGLGGSSAVNFLCYTKPPVADMDDLEKLGNPGWNWKNFEFYQNRSEKFIEPSEEQRKKYDLKTDGWKLGREGPIAVAFPATIPEGALRFRETFKDLGIPDAPAPLDGDPNGVWVGVNSYDPATHTRSYSTSAYYVPNQDRPNFVVLTSAYVNNLLTEKEGNGEIKATGVSFQHDGATHTVHAAREVILAAGALKSPQILELSGIGRKEVLEKINVPVKLELPGVGENVQEHVLVLMSYELREDVPYETIDLLRDPATAAEHLELHASGTGLFTTGIVGYTFAKLAQFSPKAEEIYNKIKNMIATADYTNAPPSLKEQWELMLERFNPLGGSPSCEFICFPGFLSFPNPPEAGKRYLTLTAAMNHMFSRGTIHSSSSDSSQDPAFDPHYLEQSVDLDILVEMCKFIRVVANSSPFKDIFAKELNPGPEVQTDDEWRAFVKSCFGSIWHTAGSCSMLPKEKEGVVDQDLKVHGTSNVRVVDLSVLPLHVTSHPQTVVYGMAEQAADIIKGKFTT